MLDETQVGRLVFSKAGRDAGRYYIIVSVLNDQYVYICDGDLRKIEKPKKKKVKHLNLTDIYFEEIQNSFFSRIKVNNSHIKKFLQSEDIYKEV